MSDEELMRKYQKGDEEAFNLLYAKYSPLVFGYIYKRLRDSEAQDFYQKVWRHLHEKRSLFHDQPFAPWFFVMIRNLLTDEYRSLGKKDHRYYEKEIREKIYQETSLIDVEEKLKKLTPDVRALVEKYYLDDVSYEELEKQTGQSQAGLRQKLSRAIRGLRLKLKDEYEE